MTGATSRRLLLGFAAAAISVLTFHQAMWAVLHAAGLMAPAPYPMRPTTPLGVPLILSLCFWGGLYGAVFGMALPRLGRSYWAWGIGLGVLAACVGLFVVTPLKGNPINLDPIGLARSMLINGFWGLGVGLIAPVLIGGVARATPDQAARLPSLSGGAKK